MAFPELMRHQRLCPLKVPWPSVLQATIFPAALGREPSLVAGKAASYLCFMRDLARLIIQHYERHALAWDADRRRSAWTDKPWHERFMAQMPRPARVLDLGCGSGWPVARHLAAGGLRVTGVDSSPTLISLCRRRLPDHDWMVADMRTLSLACRFEGILAWDSYFHLDHDDQRHMFAVFAAHAKPGTILMFNAGPRRGEAIGTYRGDPLYHASLAASEYRRLLGQSGFAPIAHVRNDARAGGRTVWLARARLIARSLANAVGDAKGASGPRRRRGSDRVQAPMEKASPNAVQGKQKRP